MIWILAAASAVAAVPAGLRQLRIAQREHYLAPWVTRFAIRWWTLGVANSLLLAASLASVAGAAVDARFGFLAVLAQIGPIGLSVRGRTSPLAWTARLKRLASGTAALIVALITLGALLGLPAVVVLALVLLPVLVDISLVLLGPLERRLGDRWVRRAARRLEASGAKVVAITGSYGKTTTKQYVHHLLSGSVRTVASPASFNNRMGLARALNEHLVPGTEVFVAEMGTYGAGEIADLCRWIKPTVAAMVAIGPVHLERFGSEEKIVEAKAEIFDRAEVGVISVDHPLLKRLVYEREGELEIVTASADGNDSDVSYHEDTIYVGDSAVASVPDGIFPINLAVAVGIVKGLGHRVDGGLFQSLPRAEHRQSVSVSPSGITIIDDTFNANPAGALRGLASLARSEGRKVLVTPGLVELGPIQDAENESFARSAASICDEIIVVGRTNRKALLRGAGSGPASVTVVANREAAVELVRSRLGPGDAVLYENDLPDHYP